MDVFSKLVGVFGSQAELARQLGVSSMTISQWKSRGRIPAERCAVIAQLSDGRLQLSDLRPDLFPGPSPDKEPSAA